jgi:hypothetical protein
MTNVASLPQRLTADDISNALPEATSMTSAISNAYFAAVTNQIINETQFAHLDAAPSATAEAEVEQAFTAEDSTSSETTDEEMPRPYFGQPIVPRFTHAAPSVTAEAAAEQDLSTPTTDEESDYEGPRFTPVTFCRNCDTAIGVEGSVMRECSHCNTWTMCTHCEYLEACRNCLPSDSEGGQHNRWRQRFQYGGSSSSAWERFSSAQP